MLEALLKEVLVALRELVDILKAELPEGETDFYDVSLSAENHTHQLVPPTGTWYSVFVRNDGPSQVTVATYYGKAVTLNEGESLKITPRKKVIKGLTLMATGNTTVRVACLR